jgi:hypothetical protein
MTIKSAFHGVVKAIKLLFAMLDLLELLFLVFLVLLVVIGIGALIWGVILPRS